MSDKPQNLECPDCGGEMVSRKNNKDGSRFWGCKSFPQCRGTRDSMGLSKSDRQALNDPADESGWRERDYYK